MDPETNFQNLVNFIQHGIINNWSDLLSLAYYYRKCLGIVCSTEKGVSQFRCYETSEVLNSGYLISSHLRKNISLDEYWNYIYRDPKTSEDVNIFRFQLGGTLYSEKYGNINYPDHDWTVITYKDNAWIIQSYYNVYTLNGTHGYKSIDLDKFNSMMDTYIQTYQQYDEDYDEPIYDQTYHLIKKANETMSKLTGVDSRFHQYDNIDKGVPKFNIDRQTFSANDIDDYMAQIERNVCNIINKVLGCNIPTSDIISIDYTLFNTNNIYNIDDFKAYTGFANLKDVSTTNDIREYIYMKKQVFPITISVSTIYNFCKKINVFYKCNYNCRRFNLMTISSSDLEGI